MFDDVDVSCSELTPRPTVHETHNADTGSNIYGNFLRSVLYREQITCIRMRWRAVRMGPTHQHSSSCTAAAYSETAQERPHVKMPVHNSVRWLRCLL